MSAQISLRTSPELVGRFTVLAEATGGTRSFLINQAMKKYIARET